MHAPIEFVDTTTVMFGKLVLAVVLGAVLGTERAVIARQVAGTRTFGLVALAACLFIVVSNYVDSAYIGLANVQPLQLAAGIVTGMGFLGAGVIIFRGDKVHGITTAAGLWLAAAVGMTVGFGMYTIAIFTTLITLAMLIGMWYIEDRFKHWFDPHAAEKAHSSATGEPGLPHEIPA